MADSRYAMLVSQSLLEHGSFALDHYAIPHLEPVVLSDHIQNGDMYHLELAKGHIYYYFPPGTSVLSVPFVAVMNAFGISVVNTDGTYSARGEGVIQALLAAILMSALAVIFFYTARLVLPLRWSVVVAVGGALGTQVWSTASRSLWSDTWGILLLGVVLWMFLAHETARRTMSPSAMATLLAWMYFVRPTHSITIIALSVYIFLYHRKLFAPFALTGAIWAAGFVIYSWYNFGKVWPGYYTANRLTFTVFWTALAGNLISPSRGLLIYVPVLLFVAYLLARYRKHLAFPRIVWLALAVCVAHLIVISGFSHWWGGHSFGPRFSTGLVPWFVLLAIMGVQAMLRWRQQMPEQTNSSMGWRVQLALGATLLLCSMVINGLGATEHATWLWNIRPVGVDEHPERLWDWRHPQFLAKWQR